MKNPEPIYFYTAPLLTYFNREEFETHSLIFIQNEQNQYRWVKPSECLWSSATEIQDRTSLNTYYDDELEDFFVGGLGVPRLDVHMVYDELLRVDHSHATVRQVKDLLWQMNALLEADKPKGSSERLLKIPILPVRYPSGEVKLLSGQNDFAIVDRRPLQEFFQSKVKLFDFSLSEVHKLEPFLRWAGLRSRFLSKVIKEISLVDPDSAYPLSDPSQNIARRAQALTRYVSTLVFHLSHALSLLTQRQSCGSSAEPSSAGRPELL